MNFNSLQYPYMSKRTTVMARKGVVASSQYLASQAGLEILKKGGNAIDAAVACAACLTVTEPTSNGLGGDAFALIWYQNKLYGLNSSGAAPYSLHREALSSMGLTQIPLYGLIPVTVPGAPAAWAEVIHRFGKLSLPEVLQPAIQYADEGYPVSPVVSENWNYYLKIFEKEAKGTVFDAWFQMFAPHDRAPLPGEIWRSPDLARTLKIIAESKAQSFYQGDLAEKISTFSKNNGGFLAIDDLSRYRPEWVEPLKIDYDGYSIWELPPNGHGIVVLMALNILKNLHHIDLDSLDEKEREHIAVEAIKLAFKEGFTHIGDPRYSSIPVAQLLSDDHARMLGRKISNRVYQQQIKPSNKGGTVYLATADEEGNMVSFIQSNYTGFGSGVVVPGTGIALHNRGNSFNLTHGHPNCLEPGKRPYHTIIPGFITKDSQAIGPFGVMGAMMQPQGHLQVILNMIHSKLNPQSALDKPRWQWIKDNTILVEKEYSVNKVNYLRALGHDVQVSEQTATFGRGQIIWRDEKTGVYIAGTEPRADSVIACY